MSILKEIKEVFSDAVKAVRDLPDNVRDSNLYDDAHRFLDILLNGDDIKAGEFLRQMPQLTRWKNGGLVKAAMTYENTLPILIQMHHTDPEIFIRRNKNDGSIVLHDVVGYVRKEALDFMAHTGASLDVQNNEGLTPLMIAVQKKHEIARQLVGLGADVHIKNGELNALDYTVQYLKPFHIPPQCFTTAVMLLENGIECKFLSPFLQKALECSPPKILITKENPNYASYLRFKNIMHEKMQQYAEKDAQIFFKGSDKNTPLPHEPIKFKKIEGIRV